MVSIEKESYAGFDCVRVSNEVISLWITKSIGPRIIGLSLKGGENLFALLPDAQYTHQNGDVYYFRGGHRLWVAPEEVSTTYYPDNQPVSVTQIENGIEVIQPEEDSTGLQKSMKISLPDDDQAVVRIEHRIENLGTTTAALAAWAISQLRPGGVGILPMNMELADEHGLLPNRQLALWPYTYPGHPLVSLGKRYLLVTAAFDDGPFKVGFPNPRGWLGYLLEGTLFVKQAKYDPQALYYDLNSSSECYCGPMFLELETLGPKTVLKPGEHLIHYETWRLYEDMEYDADEDYVDGLLSKYPEIELAIQMD